MKSAALLFKLLKFQVQGANSYDDDDDDDDNNNNALKTISIVVNSEYVIQFNSYLLTCRLNSTNVN